jgi:hypothetical protein
MSYLCWINADVRCVDSFLKKYPEALLLEGTNQDTARSIVEHRLRRCTCTDRRCNENRIQVLEKLDKGFEEYQSKHMKDLLRGKVDKSHPLVAKLKSTFVFPQLMTSGRYLRGLAVEESAVRSQVLELHVAKAGLEQEVKELRAVVDRKTPRAMVRVLFACTTEKSKDKGLQLSKLELDLQIAQQKLSMAHQEHKLLIDAIDRGQKSKYVLLQKAFEGCDRYVCVTQDDDNEVRWL